MKTMNVAKALKDKRYRKSLPETVQQSLLDSPIGAFGLDTKQMQQICGGATVNTETKDCDPPTLTMDYANALCYTFNLNCYVGGTN